MEIKDKVKPEYYSNLEMTFNILKYPHLKGVAGRVTRVLTHCQRTLEPEEKELYELLQEAKVQTAEYMGYIDNKILVGTNYAATELVVSQLPISAQVNSHYRKMSRDELFQNAFDTMNIMKGCITEEMGVLRHPAPVKHHHLSINSAVYIDKYQTLFSSMDNIYTYFEPTAEESNINAL